MDSRVDRVGRCNVSDEYEPRGTDSTCKKLSQERPLGRDACDVAREPKSSFGELKPECI